MTNLMVLTKAGHVVKKMQNNRYFTSGKAIVKGLKKACSELEGEMNNFNRLSEKRTNSVKVKELRNISLSEKRTNSLKELRKQLEFYYRYAAAYVKLRAFECPEEADKLLESSGFDFKKAREVQMKVMTIKRGNEMNSIEVRNWLQYHGATYLFQISVDQEHWEQKITSFTRFTFYKLEPGVYWFRIARVINGIEEPFCLPKPFLLEG